MRCQRQGIEANWILVKVEEKEEEEEAVQSDNQEDLCLTGRQTARSQ